MKCHFCSNRVDEMKRSRICRTCYSFMYYWQRKGIAAILARQQKLAVFDKRLTALAGNVRLIGPRRRKAG